MSGHPATWSIPVICECRYVWTHERDGNIDVRDELPDNCPHCGRKVVVSVKPLVRAVIEGRA